MSSLSDRIRGIVSATPGPTGPGLQPSSPTRLLPDVVAGDSRTCGDLDAVLGGGRREACFVVERRWGPDARHGRETIGAIAGRLGEAAAYAPLFAGGAPARPPFVFLDIETTGLSGGAGTQAFLVGYGSFGDDRSFVVRQILLTSYADERWLLETVASVLRGAGALVSFNGKSFDAPVLETRYLFHRLEWAGARVPHVDLLHPARRFWGSGFGSVRLQPDQGPPKGGQHRKGDDCSLVALERSIVGARRVGDVPGVEIPRRYFQFVRTGDARPLVAVLEHNRLDLLTLAALTSRLFHLARIGPAEARTAREALALGHVCSRAGMARHAREAFERAVALCGARAAESGARPAASLAATKIDALRALAGLWRRARRFEEAARCWRQLLDVGGCPAGAAREATEALAIHHEHRVRDLASARAFALRGLESGAHQVPRSWARAARHRLARLERKIARAGSLELKLEA